MRIETIIENTNYIFVEELKQQMGAKVVYGDR